MTMFLSIVSFGLVVFGFGGVSLAMPRHHRDVFGGEPARRIVLIRRIAGYVLLALALWSCIEAFGPSVGIVAWLGMLSAGALAVVGLLAWRPRFVFWAGFAAVPILSCLLFPAGWRG